MLEKIRDNAVEEDITRSVLSADGVASCWVHNEKDGSFNADYVVDLGVFGGPYSKSISLADCCQEFYETTSPKLNVNVGSLGSTSYGAIGAVAPATVIVGESTLTLGNDAAAGMTLRLTRNTGIVTGTLKLSGDAGKAVSATWKGVSLQGWGPGCGCAPGGDVFLPFVNGAFFFNDSVQNGTGKKLTIKRGGSLVVE